MATMMEPVMLGAKSSVNLNEEEFLQSVADSPESALLLDYDGTLAPFRIDPTKVQPWTGVRRLLQQIQDEGRTRIVIVTGRPALEMAPQLVLRKPLEIFGAHGAERLYPGGRLEQDELFPQQRQALVAARNTIHSTSIRLGVRVEEKWNAIALHWRGIHARLNQAAQKHCLELFSPFADVPGMQLLRFDGGLELRAGRNKGNAVLQVLTELESDSPIAYLGDDRTDEDAFEALGDRGLGVLVRRQWVPSAAHLWLRPPTDLVNFLAAWLEALQQ
ncbi:MAG: trehalose-phosphatase [Terracidiphilus sp.]